MKKKGRLKEIIIAIVVIAIVGGEYYWLNSDDSDESFYFYETNEKVDSNNDSISPTRTKLDTKSQTTTSKCDSSDSKKEVSRHPVVKSGRSEQKSVSKTKPKVPARKDPFSASQYKTYHQERWNYTIKYPKFLTKSDYSQNGDGAVFEDGNGIVMTTYGGWNVFNETITDLYKKNMKDVRKVTYKRLFKNKKCYVKSGYLKDNRIFYMREAIIGKPDAEVVVTLVLYYPQKYKKKADKVIRDTFTKFPVLTKK